MVALVPRPVILPAQVQEGWQHPSGRYFYIASSDQRTSTARVRHHYLNAFRVDSSGDLQPHGGAVELPHRPIRAASACTTSRTAS